MLVYNGWFTYEDIFAIYTYPTLSVYTPPLSIQPLSHSQYTPPPQIFGPNKLLQERS